jgi:uncharacterized protein (DUF302 family)
MQYYMAKTVSGSFPATVERVIEALKVEGFGVLTEIDITGYSARATRPWRIRR